ncbi:MAG: MBL fold metallo-hydrolase [Gammaproteobacteria bacterium]|nr:MBL fold metallo-hydrolase [Gammaproteobacteria bacterium]
MSLVIKTLIGAWISLSIIDAANAEICAAPNGVTLQVLGSGGPELDDRRASSSYVVWIDGKSRVLVDAGGGSALYFGQSGAQVRELDAILFTHFHVDHSVDFPALIKSSFFESPKRERWLPIYGPDGNEKMPSTKEFLRSLFNAETGVYRYLSDHIAEKRGVDNESFELVPRNVQLDRTRPVFIHRFEDLEILAIPVDHGPIPAVAYRVNWIDVESNVIKASVVFSGDMNATSGHLEKLAKEADVLVAHNAITNDTTGMALNLHMTPLAIGEIAAEAKVGRVVLSHRMLRALGHEPETLEAIEKNYSGAVNFADDNDCFVVGYQDNFDESEALSELEEAMRELRADD